MGWHGRAAGRPVIVGLTRSEAANFGYTRWPMSEFTAGAWKQFRDRFQAAEERLADAIAATTANTRLAMERVGEQLSAAEPEAGDGSGTGAFERLFAEVEQRLFSAPLEEFERADPIGSMLAAIGRNQAEMDELPRMLPAAGAQVGAAARRAASPGTAPLRDIARAHAWGRMRRRARLDEALGRVLARSGLHLVAAWQLYRRRHLASLAGAGRDETALAAERRWWSQTAAALTAQAERLARAYRRDAEASPARLEKAMQRRSPQFSPRRQARIRARWQAEVTRWHRRGRAVRAVIALERQLTLVALAAAGATQAALASVRSEHEGVRAELDSALAWLDTTIEPGNHGAFPPPQASVLSAGQRARDWSQRIAARAGACVPETIEVVRLGRVGLHRRGSWRQMQPQRELLQALRRAGLEAAREGLAETETGHTAAIRDIEHARQVIAYAGEARTAGGDNGPRLAAEAAANARALLQRRADMLTDPQPAAAQGLCRAEALTLLQTHTALERGRLGLLALLTREGGPRAARNAGALALGHVRAGTLAARTGLGRAREWAGWKLGLERQFAQRSPPVIEQPCLSAILEIELRRRELPALYQRLFHLTPVEDQRFLVGREVEMHALAEVFARWQSGGRVNVVVMGARGSGKTSLLNCASSAAFAGAPVVRGQFSRRIPDAAAMSAFLQDLFGLPAGEDLAAALNRGRRVAVIEDLERTFLRRANGFETLRGFLRLMTATSGATLWILGMNRASYQYLDAVVGLGQHFSHRINAMAVSREQVAEAILQRHALSGLRLQFAPPPPGDRRVRRVRRFFGLELSPQQLFFDALYGQSEGLFRSALELWLGSIERIEGSVVHMRQPLDPDYSRLEAGLKPDNYFTLQAILQHSSLTADEVAEIFNTSGDDARRRLEPLVALGVLEPEPASLGLRISPQAGRFVRDALNNRNLL